MPKQRKNWILFAVFGASLISVFWMMSVKNTFCYDDLTHLRNVSMKTYSELFTFFPSKVYLDRPVGFIVMKIMYELFETDYVLYHITQVLIHLLNVALVYGICERIFMEKFEKDDDRVIIGSAIAAGFFGAWPKTHMAVLWFAAVFDLIGCTFALLSIMFFFRCKKEKKFVILNIVLSVLFFLLAIRTKEMFYPLPVLYLIYDVYITLKRKERFRISIPTLINIVVMLVFFSGIIYWKLQDTRVTNDINNVYYQSFNPVDMIKTLLQYCAMCFDMKNSDFYWHPSTSGLIGVALVLVGLIIAIGMAIFKRNFSYLLCYICIGVSISTVLPQINQCHVLYLYFPSVFLGLLIASFIVDLPRVSNWGNIALGVVLAGCLFAGNSVGYLAFKDGWYATCAKEHRAWNDIESISKPVSGTKVYVKLEAPSAYNPFMYGPGSVVNLIYQDMSLETVILHYNEEIEYEIPYVIWESESDGSVREIVRDMTYE